MQLPGSQDPTGTSQWRRLGGTLAGLLGRAPGAASPMPHAGTPTAPIVAEECARLVLQVLANVPEGVMVTGPTGTILGVNAAFARVTGYDTAEATGRKPKLLRSGHHPPEFYQAMWQSLDQTGRWAGEIWNRRKSGDIYPEWLDISRVTCAQGGTCHVAVYSSVGQKEDMRERLHHLAYYDALTGLPNRQLFTDRLRQGVALAQREDRPLALLFLDLDRFKEINDTLGHDVGDGILRSIATRVTRCLRDSDTFSRLGGDEFTVILPKVARAEHAVQVAEKIVRQIASPHVVDGHELYLSTSIGIALFPDHGRSPEELLKHADTAMYRAKENGRNRCEVYTRVMTESVRRQWELDTELRRALERGELTVSYQPIVTIGSGRIAGVEALARWHHPRLGAVPPDVFVPVAEHVGVIGRLGAHVLRAAARQVQVWREQGAPWLRLAYNVSAVQLRQPGLVELIAAVYAETGLPLSELDLEIKESAFLDRGESLVGILLQLHQLGCRIAIDDFGTGYSSLSNLRRLPIHRLKVDQSVVAHVHDDPNDAAIAATIVSMAHHLKLRVTAEGVETAEQLAFLRQHRCHEAQGYFFSAPSPPELIAPLLRAGLGGGDHGPGPDPTPSGRRQSSRYV
jgi:diguanylate cyclase (GGDEF)-like protein/PAS domain S-box-containing protein